MTANQVNYWKLKEEERSNRAKEDIDVAKNKEVMRHNIEQENLNTALAYLQALEAGTRGFSNIAAGVNQNAQAAKNTVGAVNDIIGGPTTKLFS